jgi:cytochrome c oxidase cbb3-type subunit 1
MTVHRVQTGSEHAPTAVDDVTVKVTFEYLAHGTFWLLVGTFVGLLAAHKLNWPDSMAVPWLSFGRIRPIHTNTVFWGWSSMALTGLAIFVVSRTSRTPLWSPRLARISLWLWNACVVGGIVTLATGGTRGPQEYREYVWWVAGLLMLGAVLNGYNLYRTVAARKVAEIYVSNWYILGAFCWVAVIAVTGYLPIWDSGVENVIIQGYYMHNGVGMWFTPMCLGITYYALPRLLGKPIYSYALGVLGFWTALLFYPTIGAHHFIFSPVPWWIQTTAILFSVGMMVPVWAGAGNLLLTLKGSWDQIRRSYSLPFVLTGVIGYALSSTQGTMEAFRNANIYWHFTNFTIGHSHLAMYGFVAFIIWGSAYGLVPRITGREPSPIAVGLHFWLSLGGIIIYVLATSIAGILQGFSWVAGEPFIESVIAAENMWLWRTTGGALMVAGHLVWTWNLWTMRPRAREVVHHNASVQEAV